MITCDCFQAPFFPKEAELKNATATEYGLVFGVFELVVCIASPFYGQFLNRIGPKVSFNNIFNLENFKKYSLNNLTDLKL